MRGRCQTRQNGGDAPRRLRDDRAERSTRDGGVPVEGGSGDRR
jgi:hypothetical protein